MPTFRQVSPAATVGGNNNNIAPALSSAALAGSLLLLVERDQPSAAPAASPAGWTLLRTDANGSYTTHIWYKIAAGGETSVSISYTGGGNAFATALILEYTSPAATPFDTSGSDVSIIAPSVTATTNTAMLIAIASMTSGSSMSFTAPSGMTLRATVGDTLSSQWIGVAELGVNAGATGARTFGAGTVGISQLSESVVLAGVAATPYVPPLML